MWPTAISAPGGGGWWVAGLTAAVECTCEFAFCMSDTIARCSSCWFDGVCITLPHPNAVCTWNKRGGVIVLGM